VTPPDVLVVSVDTTTGWRTSARALTGALSRAGARAELVETGPVAQVRTFALTDLVQARAARAAYSRAVAAAGGEPGAVVYCAVTAALLWPRPGAIWLDAVAAENRPGRHGVWQRQVERRRLRQAPLVLAMSEHALAPLPGIRPDAIVLPSPVEPSGPLAAERDTERDTEGDTERDTERDIDVLAYAGDPEKKRLHVMLETWSRVRAGGEELVVAGVEGAPPLDGVRFAGRLAADACSWPRRAARTTASLSSRRLPTVACS
jgi:hypothetical protein